MAAVTDTVLFPADFPPKRDSRFILQRHRKIHECRKVSRSKRQARILARKRQYGDRVLTFAELGKIVSNPGFIDLSSKIYGRWRVLGYWGVGLDGRIWN